MAQVHLGTMSPAPLPALARAAHYASRRRHRLCLCRVFRRVVGGRGTSTPTRAGAPPHWQAPPSRRQAPPGGTLSRRSARQFEQSSYGVGCVCGKGGWRLRQPDERAKAAPSESLKARYRPAGWRPSPGRLPGPSPKRAVCPQVHRPAPICATERPPHPPRAKAAKRADPAACKTLGGAR